MCRFRLAEALDLWHPHVSRVRDWPCSPQKCQSLRKVVDGLFKMQHNIPKKSAGWSQSLEKDVAKSSGSQDFSKDWLQSPRKLRKFLVFSFGSIPYWTFLGYDVIRDLSAPGRVIKVAIAIVIAKALRNFVQDAPKMLWFPRFLCTPHLKMLKILGNLCTMQLTMLYFLRIFCTMHLEML